MVHINVNEHFGLSYLFMIDVSVFFTLLSWLVSMRGLERPLLLPAPVHQRGRKSALCKNPVKRYKILTHPSTGQSAWCVCERVRACACALINGAWMKSTFRHISHWQTFSLKNGRRAKIRVSLFFRFIFVSTNHVAGGGDLLKRNWWT